MKPLQIKMSAFGSYKKEVTVDFTVVDHGIFLITGDTGAGKTTIFDAITYALYDQSSTDVKNGSMMRSQYADNNTPTFVELIFEERGQSYRIRRNPAYEREGKRRGKDKKTVMVSETAKVALYLPDGSLFPGKVRETNEKIIEIVGIPAEQFTQTVMLAQGEFMRLLFASSRERKDIFAKLFDTSLYGLIQQRLRDSARALEEQLSQGQKLWELYEKELPWRPEEVAGEQELTKGKTFSSGDMAAKSMQAKERLLAALKEHIEQEQSIQESNHRMEEQQEQEIQRLTAFLIKLERERELFRRLDMAKGDAALLGGQKAEAQLKRERIAQARQAQKAELLWNQAVEAGKRLQDNQQKQADLRQELCGLRVLEEKRRREQNEAFQSWQEKQPSLQEKQILIKGMLPVYEQLENAEKKEKEAGRYSDSLRRGLEELDRQQTQTQKQLQQAAQLQERLKGAEAQVIRLEAEANDQEQKKVRLKDICTQLEQLSGEWSEYQNSAAMARRASEEAQKAGTLYDRLYRSFLTEQAGLMAAELKEGEPCPVCGSRHHPDLRIVSRQAPSQSQVEEAKQQWEQAGQGLREASAVYAQKRQQYTTHQKHIGQLGSKELGEGFEANRNGLNQALCALQAAQEKSKSILRALELARGDFSDWKKGEQQSSQLEKHAEGLRKKREALQQELLKAEADRAAVSQQVRQLKEGLQYKSSKEAQAELKNLEGRLTRLQDSRDRAEQALREIQTQQQTRNGQLQALAAEAERLETEKQQADSCVQRRFQELGFSDEADYRRAAMEPEQLQQLEQWCQEYEQRLAKAEAAVETLLQQTEGCELLDPEPFQAELTNRRREKEQLSAIQKQQFGKLEQERRIYGKLRELAEDRKKLDQRYFVASRLDRTANGRVAGTAGIDFQTYLQRSYFKQIIARANHRLLEMTSGEYLLSCRDIKNLGKQGEVGLDLDVYSTMTGKQRDVKTLSGGESFMAALSMALGMADIIRSKSGRIRMDMMFIDEGFGTLDEESRSQAIRVLCELAGDSRLIGIISHVTQLKEQISRKLIVTKGKEGSSLRWDLG